MVKLACFHVVNDIGKIGYNLTQEWVESGTKVFKMHEKMKKSRSRKLKLVFRVFAVKNVNFFLKKNPARCTREILK